MSEPRDLNEEAQLDTYREWTGNTPGVTKNGVGWTFHHIAQRMFDAHLAILSESWAANTCFVPDCVAPCCPQCGGCSMPPLGGHEDGFSSHQPGCPWLISAKACGVAK